MGNPTVFIVDDDESLRDSVGCLLETVSIPFRMFSSAAEFLQVADPQWQGCLLLDVRMRGMSGMELLEKLETDGAVRLPVIIFTGHGDVPMAVRALKHGALDFLQKPFNGQDLLDRIHAAFQLDRQNCLDRNNIAEQQARFDSLSPREKDVIELVVAGNSSKVIGQKLGISCKTADIHRSNIMKKFNAKTVAELVKCRMALKQSGSAG